MAKPPVWRPCTAPGQLGLRAARTVLRHKTREARGQFLRDAERYQRHSPCPDLRWRRGCADRAGGGLVGVRVSLSKGDSRANFAGREALPKPLGAPESEAALWAGWFGGGWVLAGRASPRKGDSRANLAGREALPTLGVLVSESSWLASAAVKCGCCCCCCC